MKFKRIIIGIVVVVLIIVTIIIYRSRKKEASGPVEVTVEKGKMEITVTTTGELQSENSEKIIGPTGLRTIGIWRVKISDIVAEGTVVDSGAYVATLDRTEATTKLKDVENDLQKSQTQFDKTKLDTTLELRNARDELINLKYAMEEKQIVLEQSKYEPPATLRQAKIDKEKAERAYEQALENYKLKVKQNATKMQEVSLNLESAIRKRDDILKVMDDFVIKAPKPGMVIYMKEWNGSKRKVGSELSPWDPTVATLPDLSSMMSKTYVNEIDISKIKAKQKVKIGVDAFPGKEFSGEVKEIANVGEQLPNSDAKVFEVLIKLFQTDTVLRPSMTTSNNISINTYENVLHIPLEAIHNNDTLTYVYKKSGFSVTKQVIEVGESNENEILIEKGLNEGETVLLSIPENAEDMNYEGLELYKDIKKKRENKKKEDAEKQKQQQEKKDEKNFNKK
ncbi:MAG: efflux RND transporter periplasmic adaptor subunit [Bacteroidetes bacterium]|nr:efflux RND transporter periplasmic adaptor subunit [Bacteroidota bacterium]